VDADTQYGEAKRLYEAEQTAESVTAFEQARAAYLAEGNEAKAATVADDLGVVYYLVGRFDDARRVLHEALAVFEKVGDVAAQAKATGNLAQLLNRTGDKGGAEKNYERAAELFQQVGERGLEFDTLRALSQMQLQRGYWLEALATYDRALAAKGGSGALRAFLQIPLKLLRAR
jgi:tetratricopeptide (TPR) repeat protein